MPTYVVRLSHPPESCPSSHSKIRQFIQNKSPELPTISERLGVKIVAGPFVLGSEHEGLAIVETDRVESVNDFLLESGIAQWNSVRVSMAQPLQAALAQLNNAPPPLY